MQVRVLSLPPGLKAKIKFSPPRRKMVEDSNDESLPSEGDPMLNLDFSSVPSREPLEEGVYALTIAKVEEATSSTGNPMLKIEYDVNGVDGNRKLWDNYVLIDK